MFRVDPVGPADLQDDVRGTERVDDVRGCGPPG